MLPLAWLIRIWWLTIKIDIPAADLEVMGRPGEPTIFILWHNRLFMAADIAHIVGRTGSLYSLISASGDGEWLAALFSSLGLRSVRGSSSRFGKEAASALVEKLRQGFDIGITPDGPRGPVYELKPGALIVARRSRARVVMSGFDFESSWRLASWDGFHIPKPFSRIKMRFIPVSPNELGDREEAARLLGRRLAEINPDRIPSPFRRRA